MVHFAVQAITRLLALRLSCRLQVVMPDRVSVQSGVVVLDQTDRIAITGIERSTVPPAEVTPFCLSANASSQSNASSHTRQAQVRIGKSAALYFLS